MMVPAQQQSLEFALIDRQQRNVDRQGRVRKHRGIVTGQEFLLGDRRPFRNHFFCHRITLDACSKYAESI